MKRLLIFSLILLMVVALSVWYFQRENPIHAQTSSPTPAPSYDPSEWFMAGANPQRTSWVSEEITTPMYPEKFRVFDSYVQQKIQVIAADDKLFISTAKGLYALDAATLDTVWYYPTEFPLGHSPTYHNGRIYVGGYDHKLHAINAATGAGIWTFEAEKGFDTNPLVVNIGDTTVSFLGNRDGKFYAIKDNGSTGSLFWQPVITKGSISYSAAYDEATTTLYFASNDGHAYAVNAQNGSIVWKSNLLPGDGFYSYWPVVYKHAGSTHIVVTGGENYHGDTYIYGGLLTSIERDELYPQYSTYPSNTKLGAQVTPPAWANPIFPALDITVSNPTYTTVPISEYLSQGGKPWRRTVFLFDEAGNEVTFDLDHDNDQDYAPFTYFGTHSGTRYPPAIGPDGTMYLPMMYNKDVSTIPRGNIVGWQPGSPSVSLIFGNALSGAPDEPRAYAIGGSQLYYNICCERTGASVNLQTGINRTYFGYFVLPNADMFPGYGGTYYSNTNDYTSTSNAYDAGGIYSPNGLIRGNGSYGTSAEDGPVIPYKGRLYTLRSNSILMFGPTNRGGAQRVTDTVSQDIVDSFTTPDTNEITSLLENELAKIIASGHLKPGYISSGLFDHWRDCGSKLTEYFSNPADTIWILIDTLPHIQNQTLKAQVTDYIKSEFTNYSPLSYQSIGWKTGADRTSSGTEDFRIIPPEFVSKEPTVNKAAITFENPNFVGVNGWAWYFDPHNVYAAWKYVDYFDDPAVYSAQQALNAINTNSFLYSTLITPHPTDTEFMNNPFVLNSYLAGYYGYINLSNKAGVPVPSAMTDNKNKLEGFIRDGYAQDPTRNYIVNFVSDHPYKKDTSQRYCRTLINSVNYWYLTPELINFIKTYRLTDVQTSINEFDHTMPQWFVSTNTNALGENSLSPLYEMHSVFQAKAKLLDMPQDTLAKYLDIPAFERGDLFYIDNLVSLLEAPSTGITVSPTPNGSGSPTPTSTPGDTDGDNDVDIFDYNAVISNFGRSGTLGIGEGNFDGDQDVDIFDYNVVISNFGR